MLSQDIDEMRLDMETQQDEEELVEGSSSGSRVTLTAADVQDSAKAETRTMKKSFGSRLPASSQMMPFLRLGAPVLPKSNQSTNISKFAAAQRHKKSARAHLAPCR